MNVLDHGAVNLVDFMGGDLSVVMSARVSNGKLETYDNEPEKDKRLINYLVKHRHGTPFEHSVFTFYVKCPIFVAREWMRHRIASYNEISGRYVEFEPEFYIPTKYRVPAASNKQGSVFPVDIEDNTVKDWDDFCRGEVGKATWDAYASYQTLLKRGVAKEMARMVLPVSLYTQFFFTINARSLMNFLGLRMGDDAQFEIRQYANAIYPIFADSMPMTAEAWVANNYVSP